MTPGKFASEIGKELAQLADPTLAVPMAAYMKGRFVFIGIKTPARRAATRPLISKQSADLVESAQALWALPFREYQYVACDLLQRHAGKLPRSSLPSVLRLATRKSWWDTVDPLSKVVGTLAKNFPDLAARAEKLADDDNMWLRRVAILHQLGCGARTDSKRLFRICLTNAADPDFFIRKAIGWALRDYARHDPAAVRRFLKQHEGALSSLTLREAGKHL